MSAPAIRVAGLGKRYLLRHRQPERYAALRDAIAARARALGRGLRGRRAAGASPAREEFWALREVAFEVGPGERVGVIGRNGAGKSTLLKLLGRITEPTTGRIELEGRVASLLEVGTGFHPELTGRENVFLNGAILGMGRAEIRRKFDEIVAFAEVEKFLDTPVKRYSSGMYVRLAFAVAAHLEPEILLVDEVLAVGDVQFQKKCLGKMEAVGREGRTVVFVSHNLAAVHRLCPGAVLLEGGRVAAQGRTADVVAAYLAGIAPPEPRADGGPLVADELLEVLRFEPCGADGRRRSVLKTSEELGVLVAFRVRKEEPGLRVGFDLVNAADGAVVFRSFDDDLGERPRGCGEYRVLGRVPADLLRPGVYELRLKAGVHNRRWIVEEGVSARVTVEAVDGVNSRYADPRPGCVMPRVTWEDRPPGDDGARG